MFHENYCHLFEYLLIELIVKQREYHIHSHPSALVLVPLVLVFTFIGILTNQHGPLLAISPKVV